MREQFWGWIWWSTNKVFGVHTRLSLWLEGKWSAAYWATRPPLSIGPCTIDCTLNCPRRDQ